MADLVPQMAGWERAGPKAEAYGLCQAAVALCVGPTGGGKTTESARRTLRIAQWQHPSPKDGIRKARIVVAAPTYRRLWDQVIPSYKKVIPWWDMKAGPKSKLANSWTGAKGDPADHIYDVEWQGFGRVHVEVLFRAVGDMSLEEFFRGLEFTALWLPEMDTQASGDILSLGLNRAGRYPEPDDRPVLPEGTPPAYAGVYGDANAPRIGDWFHKRFFLAPRKGEMAFIQPGGFDPQAENLHNLRKIRPDYYEHMASNLEPWDVERLVNNRPGYSREGQPVQAHFNPLTNVAQDGIEADPSLTLQIGIDAGSNTMRHAATFGQRAWSSQLRALGEVAPEGQSDIMEFSAEVKRLRETKFAHVKDAEIVVDPAARGQTAMKRGVTWAQVLSIQTGIRVRLASSNDPAVRRGALSGLLKRQAGPGEPAFVVSGPDCPKLIEALSGGFRYKRKGDKLSPTPEKNDASHIAESCEYLALGAEGVALIGGGHNPGGRWGGQNQGSLSCILPD